MIEGTQLSLEEKLKLNEDKKISGSAKPQKKVTNEILSISGGGSTEEPVTEVKKEEPKVEKKKKEAKVDDRAKLLLRIPEDMKENLSILADRDGRTVTGLITILLKKYINEDENKSAILEARETQMKF